MDTKILVVEDEKAIANLSELYLKNESFIVFKCNTGGEAMKVIETPGYQPNLVE